MALGQFRRSTLALILLASAFVPTARAAGAAEPQKTPANRYADTAVCPGKQPSGSILYVASPDTRNSESHELIVAKPNGLVVRKIEVQKPNGLFPADKSGKFFVSTKEGLLYLVDAESGKKFKLEVPAGVAPFPSTLSGRMATGFEYQVLYGGSTFGDYVVDLTTGETEHVWNWLNEAQRANYGWANLTPDGRHVVVVAATDLLIGEAGDFRSLRVVDSRVMFDNFYYTSDGMMYYRRLIDTSHYDLMVVSLDDGLSRLLITSPRRFGYRVIYDPDQLILFSELPEDRTRLALIDLPSGKLVWSENYSGLLGSLVTSPDDSQILFSTFRGSEESWHLKSLIGGTTRTVPELSGLAVNGFPMRRWEVAWPNNTGSPFEPGQVNYGFDLIEGKLSPNMVWDRTWSNILPQESSDDGRFRILLAIIGDHSTHFAVQDLSKGTVRQLSEGEVSQSTFSPDDCWIAYSSHETSASYIESSLYVMSLIDGEPRKIGEGTQPIWIIN